MYEIIHDVISGEITQRDFTAKEVAEVEAAQAQTAKEAAERDTAQAAKDADKAALLAKLGITADEAKLLLG